MSFRAVLMLAVGALWGKKSRNLLTMSGVTIGVFALTVIIALGQGLRSVITDSVASDSNLRQIRLMGGLGEAQVGPSEEIEISGDMSESRRLRLRRSALNRRRVRRSSGRRVTTITDNVIKKLSELDHIESIQPIVTERYQLTVADHTAKTAVSFGVDVDRQRYRERVMTGRYFSSKQAKEVILHEYLLYQWGLISPQEQERLIGKTLTLTSIGNSDISPQQPKTNPMIGNLTENLSEEELKALQVVLPKLMNRFSKSKRVVTREFEIVGVFREFETGEPFNVVEDVNSSQADVYLAHDLAQEFFMSSSVNSELGYNSALVTVDDSSNAADVEQTLRDRGFTAFSVSGVLQQVERSLTVVTVLSAFLTGIALLVSTLGIINTMITSVLERTREIGIYKAVGATDKQVMGMFLIESGLIGLFGGLLGLGLAVLATFPGDAIAARLIAEQAALSLEESLFVMPLWLLVGGPILGTLTAVLAAIIPARRASRIDPVHALRHD